MVLPNKGIQVLCSPLANGTANPKSAVVTLGSEFLFSVNARKISALLSIWTKCPLYPCLALTSASQFGMVTLSKLQQDPEIKNLSDGCINPELLLPSSLVIFPAGHWAVLLKSPIEAHARLFFNLVVVIIIKAGILTSFLWILAVNGTEKLLENPGFTHFLDCFNFRQVHATLKVTS